MKTTAAELWYTPISLELRRLPEGPLQLPNGEILWVAIEHGKDAGFGSMNFLQPNASSNESIRIHERPGFAWPTTDRNQFVFAAGKSLGVLNRGTREWNELASAEQGVDETIANDGMCLAREIFWGFKDVGFSQAIAGLHHYSLDAANSTVALDGQVCNNGKELLGESGNFRLLNTDSATRQIRFHQWDAENRRADPEGVVFLDFNDESLVPDGNTLTADGKRLVVAFYNPEPAEYGVVRMYDLESAELIQEWHTPGAAKATCCCFARIAGDVKLIITTAIESDDDEAFLNDQPNAGCFFIADTDETEVRPLTLFEYSG